VNTKQANDIPIVEFLAHQGFTPAKDRGRNVWYISPLRVPEKTPSFKVDTVLNKWYDHGIGVGGGLMDLALRIYRTTDIEDTFRRVDSWAGATHLRPSVNPATQKQKVPPKNTIEVIGVQPLTEKMPLVSYLWSRSIPLEVADLYCKAVSFTLNEKHLYSIGFQNRSGGYELRNPYFKGAASPKDISHFQNGSETVSVFEGFIDFLSALSSVHKLPVEGDYLVLNSASLLNKNLSAIKPYRRAICFMDNDMAGRNCLASIQTLGIDVVDASGFYAGFKDVNDWLIASKRDQPRIRKMKL